MDRPPSRKGRREPVLRMSTSLPLRAEASPSSDLKSRPPSGPSSPRSPRPRGPRPRSLRRPTADSLWERSTGGSPPLLLEAHDSPLSSHTVPGASADSPLLLGTAPPASPRPSSALLPALDIELDPNEAGQFDDAYEIAAPTPRIATAPLRLGVPRPIATPRLDPPPHTGRRPAHPRAVTWYGSEPSKPRRYVSRRRRRSMAHDVLALLVDHLTPLYRPPFPAGRDRSRTTRGILASLLPVSQATYDLVLPALYSHLVFTAASTPGLLRTLAPPLPDRDEGADERTSRTRYAVHRVHLDSLSFAPQAAWIGRAREMTIAHSLSLGPHACAEIGKSTLLSNAVARLAEPLGLCVDAGPSLDVARLTALALGLTILPAWPQLNTITLHNAHTLLVPSMARRALFRPSVKYRLAFGPLPSSWDGMVGLLRDLLERKEVFEVDNIQVVLPFDGRGSLPPPTPTRRKSLRQKGKAEPMRPKTPLGPTAQTPTRDVARKVSLGKTHADRDETVIQDLPDIARRLVRGRHNVEFVTVESLVTGSPSTKACPTCDYPWLTS